MRIAFFGTPEVALLPLTSLLSAPDVDVVAVVTNPDRPKGRSKRLVAPPVKVLAETHGIDVLQPTKPVEIIDELRALELDAVAIVAYGAILPKSVLETGGAGFVNLHFSLLPRWRGAAPVQHALIAGDEVTGVTTFVLDEGMDTGPIIDQVEVPIGPTETAGSLFDRLTAVGADALLDSVRALVAGAELRPQPAEGGTVASKIRPEDAAIDWSASATDIVNLVRGVNPAPGAHTVYRGERLKVWLAEVSEGAATPGTVLTTGKEGVTVAAGEGAVRLLEVQPAGKARMDGLAFANGYQPPVGQPLAER